MAKKIYDLSELISTLEEYEQGLASLRAWKEKARPFLENIRQTNQVILDEGNYGCVEDELEQEIKTLTELLGGSDEN